VAKERLKKLKKAVKVIKKARKPAATVDLVPPPMLKINEPAPAPIQLSTHPGEKTFNSNVFIDPLPTTPPAQQTVSQINNPPLNTPTGQLDNGNILDNVLNGQQPIEGQQPIPLRRKLNNPPITVDANFNNKQEPQQAVKPITASVPSDTQAPIDNNITLDDINNAVKVPTDANQKDQLSIISQLLNEDRKKQDALSNATLADFSTAEQSRILDRQTPSRLVQSIKGENPQERAARLGLSADITGENILQSRQASDLANKRFNENKAQNSLANILKDKRFILDERAFELRKVKAIALISGQKNDAERQNISDIFSVITQKQ